MRATVRAGRFLGRTVLSIMYWIAGLILVGSLWLFARDVVLTLMNWNLSLLHFISGFVPYGWGPQVELTARALNYEKFMVVAMARIGIQLFPFALVGLIGLLTRRKASPQT